MKLPLCVAIMSHQMTFDNPGPAGATIRGVLMPVFFYKCDFESWFDKTFGQRATASSSSTAESNASRKRPVRGRPPGSGSWAHADDPLLVEMRHLIQSGAKSACDAALKVADRAPGAGEFQSKRTRLAKRYRTKIFGAKLTL